MYAQHSNMSTDGRGSATSRDVGIEQIVYMNFYRDSLTLRNTLGSEVRWLDLLRTAVLTSL
jgi:hypothetical protein